MMYLAAVGVVFLIIGLLELSGRGPLNPAVPLAEAAAEEIAVATAGVYVSLRIINAALSAAQEIEIGASIGAQASVQPLKILEPVDDTVERVASVVFAVAAGAALAVVGVAPVAGLGLVVLGAGLLGMAGCLGMGQPGAMAGCRRAVRLGVATGLILPLGFAGGVALGERVTAVQWQAAIADLSVITTEAEILIGGGEALPDAVVPSADGLFGRLGQRLQAAGDGVADTVDAIARYRDAATVFLSEADALFGATLTIIGIFALRMVVLPVLMLWGAMTLLRRSVGAG